MATAYIVPRVRIRIEDEAPGGGRVLVLDSDPSVAKLLAERLAVDHDVAVITSAREALDHLRSRTPYDVILCDLRLGEMTGFEFLAELQRISLDAAERVVFTAEEPAARRASAVLKERGKQCLERPLDVQDVRRVIRHQLWKERWPIQSKRGAPS